GSGKTAVAALAAAIAAIRGAQTAFMAPTEVLARQHFATLKKLFGPVKAMNQPIVALMTASEARVLYADDLEASMKKEELKKKIASGEIQIVVGTHALIAGKVRAKTAAAKPLAFKNLGLVIVDEQHRFGVEQRAALTARAKSARGLLPHFLSMSATPIPRTLMLTVFGDLDISIITELPAGRKNIETRVVPPEGRAGAYALIRNEVLKGRQAFVVCPRIERPDLLNTKNAYLEKLKIDTKSVIEEYEKLSTKIFPDLRVAMLHGQMPAKAASSGKATKESVMKDFEDGKTDILVSTSVIEVGVDVPNASVMMIEGSERFGLAQLYQFRGRVGRGEYQSYCLLTTESKTKNANERLKAIVEAKNGFELAERDLKLRGPGEFLGDKQTGLPDYAMRGLQDLELVRATRAAAVAVLGRDADLAHSPALKAKLAEFRKTIHLE
ncbi:MAG: DEAD/DEAH box helicase, partial [Patescibacteria group bacterium]